MIGEWIIAFKTSMFVVVPYRYTFIYNPKQVPNRYIAGFTINTVQCAVLARCPGVHSDGFVPQYVNRSTDTHYLPMTDNSTISNVVCHVKNFTQGIQGNPSKI